MEDECNSTVVIDIGKLQSFISSHCDRRCISFHTSETESLTPKTICKVQHLIRDRDIYNTDYEPIAVSIGPYHRGNENLQCMEKVKWDCLQYILKANPQKTLHDYIEALWELYPVAQNCYVEEIEMQSSTFLHLLLLDGCYIITSICGPEWDIHNPISILDMDDNEHVELLEQNLVRHDFVLIENQVPFVTVKKIYELFTNKESIVSLSEKIAVFVEGILTNIPKPIKESERPKNFCHLLHLCHMYFRPTFNGDRGAFHLDCNNPQPNQWHQAVEYHSAGIKLKKRDFDQNNPHYILDVCFSNDVLQVPYIFIDEMIVTVIRNLIALEQTNPQFGNHITAYIDFISQLVRNADDVTLLVNREIIGHHFEIEEEVSNIFTSLGQCVVSDFSGNYYLKEICQNLEECYESRTKWGKGWLRRTNSTIRAWI